MRCVYDVPVKFMVNEKSMQDVQPLAEEDKAALRAQLVPAMLALSNPADKAIRAQVAESVSLVAELDFPAKWENLIDVSVTSLVSSTLLRYLVV